MAGEDTRSFVRDLFSLDIQTARSNVFVRKRFGEAMANLMNLQEEIVLSFKLKPKTRHTIFTKVVKVNVGKVPQKVLLF